MSLVNELAWDFNRASGVFVTHAFLDGFVVGWIDCLPIFGPVVLEAKCHWYECRNSVIYMDS